MRFIARRRGELLVLITAYNLLFIAPLLGAHLPTSYYPPPTAYGRPPTAFR